MSLVFAARSKVAPVARSLFFFKRPSFSAAASAAETGRAETAGGSSRQRLFFFARGAPKAPTPRAPLPLGATGGGVRRASCRARSGGAGGGLSSAAPSATFRARHVAGARQPTSRAPVKIIRPLVFGAVFSPLGAVSRPSVVRRGGRWAAIALRAKPPKAPAAPPVGFSTCVVGVSSASRRPSEFQKLKKRKEVLKVRFAPF